MKFIMALVLAFAAACETTPAAVPQKNPAPITNTHVAPTAPPEPEPMKAVTENPNGSTRPRYNLDGTKLAYMAGPEGSRQIYIETLGEDASVQTVEGKGDNVHPTWTPDERVIFASNRDGDFDLYIFDPTTAQTQQVTNFDGDETQPTVAPIPFGFYAAHNGICGGAASGRIFDAYQKVLFTRVGGTASEVWFASLKPRDMPELNRPQWRKDEPVVLSDHGAHYGRVTDEKSFCHSPQFDGTGLSAVYVCEKGGKSVQVAPAKFDQSFQAALDAVKNPPSACRGDVDFDACIEKLDRRYASYPPDPQSDPKLGLSSPGFSANHTLVIAHDTNGAVSHELVDEELRWGSLEGVPANAKNIVWSPTGREVAFDLDGAIQRHQTNHYLQEVRNLNAFPELLGAKKSKLLNQNRFVVRPANHKEFYVLHEKLRYEKRPQFIAADVALQVFRDEFLRLLENGEKDAARSIHALTGALTEHYVKRFATTKSKSDKYLAVLFATAWVPLEAAVAMEKMQDDDLLEYNYNRDDLEPDVAKKFDRLMAPVAKRLPAEVGSVYPSVPASIRKDVKANVERMLKHQGILKVVVPGEAKPLKVDFSQFKIRGAYAENDLGAYFLAMNWFGFMPLPLDASLPELIRTLKTIPVGKGTGLEAWRRIDALVGSFMGRPVDATIAQTQALMTSNAGLFKPFNRAQVTKKLLKARGEVPIRDASGGDRKLAVTLFPKRVGLDVTFFRKLTHPDVKLRGMPSSVDVFATLGIDRARTHAVAAEPEKMRANYQAVLSALGKKNTALASTDIYHAWLAALVAVARPYQVPDAAMLDFAKSEAWADKQLYSALAGYTQLKHSAVLYAMQDIGVECDGETSYYVAVEQPLLPPVRGFVEPNVAFYESLSKLAATVYASLWTATKEYPEPTALQWQSEDEPALNAKNFARDLADISKLELEGKDLSAEQYRWIEYLGGDLEALAMGMQPGNSSFSTGGDGRQQRGVALVTDIHTNSQRQQALQIGIGRIFDLWVAVPGTVGQTMTQGGALSFYEFTSPMSDRLTDEQWGERVDTGQAPKRPAWTKSFIE